MPDSGHYAPPPGGYGPVMMIGAVPTTMRVVVVVTVDSIMVGR
jgi:hypothetical protein